MNKLILLISNCFGIGKIPVAPGTFGSIFGLFFLFILLLPKSLPLYVAGLIIGIVFSIYACGVAEKLLNEKDPSQVVLDEIVAIPICYLGWILLSISKTSYFPSITYLLSGKNALYFVGIFITFRLLDALKPFPIKQIQNLPGGLGIVADDVLAAIMTNLIWIVVLTKYTN